MSGFLSLILYFIRIEIIVNMTANVYQPKTKSRLAFEDVFDKLSFLFVVVLIWHLPQFFIQTFYGKNKTFLIEQT